MRLLTLNTHSLIEEGYTEKLDIFVSEISRLRPDIVALQEVNQTRGKAEAFREQLFSFVPSGSNLPIRADNHALRVVEKLCRLGIFYYWTWIPIKIGYGIYDEGMAFLSLLPIENTDTVLLSASDDYSNWRTRKALGIRTSDEAAGWFYNLHMGWWSDTEEPFLAQWKRFCARVPRGERVTLMGDFNSPDERRGEGYECVLASGFYDTYALAKKKDGGITVGGEIDGWHGKGEGAMRLDYIFCRGGARVDSSYTLFNGKDSPTVSDHYGVMTTLLLEE